MGLTYYTVILTLAQLSFGDVQGKYSGVYSTFPKYRALPLDLPAARAEGYTLRERECESPGDEYGQVYSKPESRFLPGLMFNTHGQLSGMVYGVNKSDLMLPDEAFAPFSDGELRGQVYWFRDPSTTCDPDSPRSNTKADGIWNTIPDGTTVRVPERQEDVPNIGYKTNYHWTEHLCLIGMGTHVQYARCDSQYQFTGLYDADGALVGAANNLNVHTALATPPDLIETLTSEQLLGLVFNESRFDECFHLPQPRVFIHVFLAKPEVEYQSCASPPVFTPNNNQVKRCALCLTALKSLIGGACAAVVEDNETTDTLSGECCCELGALYNKTGGCADQGCVLPSTCDDHDFITCTSASGALTVTLITWLMAALFVGFSRLY